MPTIRFVFVLNSGCQAWDKSQSDSIW